MTSAEQVVHDFCRTPRADGHSESTRQALRDALQSVDLLDRLADLSVQELGEDEALLLGTDGREITTWQQDYPYAQRMSPEDYQRTKRSLQIELLKMQSWVKDTGQAVAGTSTGRFTHPQEVADLVVLLASGRAGNVTGTDILIDGGLVKTL